MRAAPGVERGLLAVTVVLCSLFVATAQALGAAWLSPADLSAPLRDASNADVAIDDAGGAVAVWQRQGGISQNIQVSTKAPGGSFSPPVDLSVGSTGSDLAMTPGGAAIVVWRHFDPGGGNYVIQAAIRPPGGSFSPPLDVASTVDTSPQPQGLRVAVNAAGDAAVVWRQQEPDPGEPSESNFVVQGSIRAAGGGFSPAVALSDANDEAAGADVAVDASGEAMAVWSAFDGVASVPQASVGDVSGGFPSTPSPVDLPTTLDNAAGPRVGVDAAGSATVVWSGFDTPAEPEDPVIGIVQAVSGPLGGPFSSPVDLSDSSGSGFEPRVAVDPAGNAVAAWTWLNASGEQIVQASSSPAGGGFPPPGGVDLSAPGQDASRPDLEMNGSGATAVVWQRGSLSVVQASIRPPGGAFGAPVDLSAAGQSALFPEASIGGTGDAVAVWTRSNGANTIAQAAGYDANAPQLRGVAIPTHGEVGIPVGFSADPFDVWPIASTVFNFGDGSAQAGTSVSHAYAAPGAYPVTVTARDQAGSAVTAGGTIAIAPSYEFSVGKHRRSKRRGIVFLAVNVSGPGRVAIAGRLVKRRARRAARAGRVWLPVMARRKALKRLRKKGKARVRATVTFRPDGGDHAARRRILVVLIKKPR